MAQSSKTTAQGGKYYGSAISQASRANTEVSNINEGGCAKNYSKFFQSVEQELDSKVCLFSGQEPLADIKAIARDILEMATSHQEKTKNTIPKHPKNFNTEELSKRLYEADVKKKQKILIMQREAYLQETAQMGEGVKANAVSQKIIQNKNYMPIHLRTANIIKAKQDKFNRLMEEKLQNEEPIPCFKPKIEKGGDQKRSFNEFVSQMDGWVAKKNLRIEEQQTKLNELEAKQMTFKPAINQKSQQLAKQLKQKQDKNMNYNDQRGLKSVSPINETQRRKDLSQQKKVSQQEKENKENIPEKKNQEFQSQENTIAEIVKEFGGLGKASKLLEHSLSYGSSQAVSENPFENQINHIQQGRFSEMNGVVTTEDNCKQQADCQSVERRRNIKKSASFSKLDFLDNYSKFGVNQQGLASRSISPLLASKTGTNRSLNDQQYRFFLGEKNEKMDYQMNISHPNLDFIIELLRKKEKHP